MKSTNFSNPLIIPPLTTHAQTWILLHGLGSNAHTFGPPLLSTPLPNGQTMQQSLPTTKFVFPTSKFRRVTALNRQRITAWFDKADVSDPTWRAELQIEGLVESCEFLHGLVRAEVEIIGPENVVVGGISQGCATALIAMLLWEGRPLRAVVGMCGFLPFEWLLDEDESENGVDDVFERDEENVVIEGSKLARAVSRLRAELEIEATLPLKQELGMPIVLCHGLEDERVPPKLGRSAAEHLLSLNVTVKQQTYDGLGHWYNSAVLQDIITHTHAQSP